MLSSLASEWIAIDIGVIKLKENELTDPQFAVKRFEKRRERLEKFCEVIEKYIYVCSN